MRKKTPPGSCKKTYGSLEGGELHCGILNTPDAGLIKTDVQRTQRRRFIRASIVVLGLAVLFVAVLVLHSGSQVKSMQAQSALESSAVKDALLSGQSQEDALVAAGAVVVGSAADAPSWFACELFDPVDYPDWKIFATGDFSVVGVLASTRDTATFTGEDGGVGGVFADVLRAKDWMLSDGGSGVYSGVKDMGDKRWMLLNVVDTGSGVMCVMAFD